MPQSNATFPVIDVVEPAWCGSGLGVGRFEAFISRDPRLALSHRHPHYEIFFVEGDASLVADFIDYPIQGHALIIIRPGQVHSWKKAEQLKGIGILFDRDFCETSPEGKSSTDFRRRVLSCTEKSPCFILPPDHDIFAIGNAIEREFREGGDGYQEIIGSLLNILLHRVARLDHTLSGKAAPPPKDRHLAQNFQLILEDSFREIRTIPEYARLLHVSPTLLNRAVKASTGQTPAGLLRERQVLEAKRLLSHSTLTSQQIAYELNFADASYFSKFFQKATGITPSNFRSQHPAASGIA